MDVRIFGADYHTRLGEERMGIGDTGSVKSLSCFERSRKVFLVIESGAKRSPQLQNLFYTTICPTHLFSHSTFSSVSSEAINGANMTFHFPSPFLHSSLVVRTPPPPPPPRCSHAPSDSRRNKFRAWHALPLLQWRRRRRTDLWRTGDVYRG